MAKNDLVSFDLETIVDPSCIPYLPEPKPDGRMKPGSEKYIADMEDKRRKQISWMPVDPKMNLICVLAWCDKNGPDSITLEDESSEKEFLKLAWDVLGKYKRFITFNGIWFDVPCMTIHSVRHQVRQPVKISTRKYVVENHIDCAAVLSGWQQKTGKFDYWCQYLGIGSGKGVVDGSQVQELWDMGDKETIAEYGKDDAGQTFLMGERIIEYYL